MQDSQDCGDRGSFQRSTSAVDFSTVFSVKKWFSPCGLRAARLPSRPGHRILCMWFHAPHGALFQFSQAKDYYWDTTVVYSYFTRATCNRVRIPPHREFSTATAKRKTTRSAVPRVKLDLFVHKLHSLGKFWAFLLVLHHHAGDDSLGGGAR